MAALLVSSHPAGAAPKSIAAIEITKVAPIAEHDGVVITNQGITLFSNFEMKVVVTSLDFTGAEKWRLDVETAPDQIAMAATSDKEGNIWLAGLTSAVGVYETQNAMSNPVNVDGVVVEQVPALRSELNCVTLWKISSAGALIATYVIETLGTQEYRFTNAQFVERFAEAYGQLAADEIAVHLK